MKQVSKYSCVSSLFWITANNDKMKYKKKGDERDKLHMVIYTNSSVAIDNISS